MAVLFLVFCYALYRYGRDRLSDRRDQQGFDSLSAIVAESAAAAEKASSPATDHSSPAQAENGDGEDGEPAAEPGRQPLPQYAALHEMNDEFFGWVRIEGIGIDHPVMYSPTRPEYYLHRDFYGEDSPSGVPFIDGRCPEDGNYYLLYGHLMANKSVFGRLPDYAMEDCWRKNPIIYFVTVYEERQYAVMSCFYTRLLYDGEEGFRYYEYFDLTDENTFNEYVSEVMKAARYDTGVTASYGDELLVLSTCSNHDPNGRFVVVGKRIS